MPCICNTNNGIRQFPKSLACVLSANETLTTSSPRLGNNSRIYDTMNEIDIAVHISSSFDMKIFTEWFINELNYGIDSFTIDLPIFGIRRNWAVKIISNLTATIKDTAESNDVKLKLVIIDNIKEAISTSGVCGVCGG